MKIHYVCRGNVYRSRMAEAYTLSKAGGLHRVSSSGIQANLALNGAVDPVAVEELNNDGIAQYLKAGWDQTTQAMLDEADIVVYVSSSLVEDAKKLFDVDNEKTKVWAIPDVDGIYGEIKKSVDELLLELN